MYHFTTWIEYVSFYYLNMYHFTTWVYHLNTWVSFYCCAVWLVYPALTLCWLHQGMCLFALLMCLFALLTCLFALLIQCWLLQSLAHIHYCNPCLIFATAVLVWYLLLQHCLIFTTTNWYLLLQHCLTFTAATQSNIHYCNPHKHMKQVNTGDSAASSVWQKVERKRELNAQP